MKRLLIFIAVTLCFQSCYRDKSEYYINQERDPDVVGVWMDERNYAFSYRKFTSDGKFYTETQYFDNDTTSDVVDWGNRDGYWYTKNGIIYTYRYYAPWSSDDKDQIAYHLSENKDTLYKQNPSGTYSEYIRTTLPE